MRRLCILALAGAAGVSACTTTALGAWLATIVDPTLGNMLFAAYLVVIAVQMAIKAIKGRKRA